MKTQQTQNPVIGLRIRFKGFNGDPELGSQTPSKNLLGTVVQTLPVEDDYDYGVVFDGKPIDDIFYLSDTEVEFL